MPTASMATLLTPRSQERTPEPALDDEALDSDDQPQAQTPRQRSRSRSTAVSTPPSALTDKTLNIAAIKLPRHVEPEPSDNEVTTSPP
jgi:hypothetical protein